LPYRSLYHLQTAEQLTWETVLYHWCSVGKGRAQALNLVEPLMWRPAQLMTCLRLPLSASDRPRSSLSICWPNRRFHTISAFPLIACAPLYQKLSPSLGYIHQFGDLLPCLRRCHEQIEPTGFRKSVSSESHAVYIPCIVSIISSCSTQHCCGADVDRCQQTPHWPQI